MEATKKTSTTKTVLLVVAALSMLLSGLFIATASRSDASPPAACPDGFSLTADAKNCFQAAVITSADNPNSCATGLITPDGTSCYVAATIVPQEGSTECPVGFSPDDSLGGTCARFELATQGDAVCPDGSRGVVGGCYILVAKGPAGAQTCTNGTLIGGQCEIVGAPPVPNDGVCPSTSINDATGCYTLSNRPSVAINCGVNTGVYVTNGGQCKAAPSNATPITLFTGQTIVCPSVTGPNGDTLTGTHTPIAAGSGGFDHSKVSFCILSGAFQGSCGALQPGPTATTCRTNSTLTSTGSSCASGFGLINGECVVYEIPTIAPASCPTNSVEDAAGDCRQPISDSDGAFTCPAGAALNGTSCVYTSGFLAIDGDVLYNCASGTRTVIGAGTSREVICITGPADDNLQSGPSCLQGVLSTDSAFCIVPRIDTAPAAAVAAPVPSFTG